MSNFSRRRFLQAGLVSTFSSRLIWGAEQRSVPSPKSAQEILVPGKDPRLVVLESKPVVLETPLELLAQNRITPTPLLFVRNNQDLQEAKTLLPLEDPIWEIEIKGLFPRSWKIGLEELKKMDQIEHEMVLQCSGNSRSLLQPKVKGTPWNKGGIGNVVFRGVRLSTLLAKIGLEPWKEAKFLTASGKDQPEPGKDDFEHSLPIEVAISRSLLALELNGKPLPAIHGGPVRLVTPGYYGTLHVKWVTSLAFTVEESSNSSHAVRYRMPHKLLAPGSEYKYSKENSRPNGPMNVKSIILQHRPDPENNDRYLVEGVAFNDGECPIEAVLISLDSGETWMKSRLEQNPSLFGWSMFRYEMPTPKSKSPLWCRTIDQFGRGQPLDGNDFWNPAGYEWNGVEKIEIG